MTDALTETGRFDAFIFDLDGTLLDTLPDLLATANEALALHGMPERTLEEVRTFVVDNVWHFFQQLAPEGTSDEKLTAAIRTWRDTFDLNGVALTKPFAQIEESLGALQAAGKHLAVVSNKPDADAKRTIEALLPGFFDAVHGECPDFPRKPDPTGLRKTIAELDCAPERCVYIGDSAGDMSAGLGAGCFTVLAGWGYNDDGVAATVQPNLVIQNASELLELL